MIMNFVISLLCLSYVGCVTVVGQTQQVQSLPVPYNVPFPYGIQPGWSVAITGIVPPNAINFTMDFECAPSSDIAFHFKPYFVNTNVVRNHRVNSVWGSEDVSGINPLRRSQPFQVKVTIGSSGFKVDMNNNLFCFYEHRIPFHKITHLSIFFDIILTSVTVAMAEDPATEAIELPKIDGYSTA